MMQDDLGLIAHAILLACFQPGSSKKLEVKETGVIIMPVFLARRDFFQRNVKIVLLITNVESCVKTVLTVSRFWAAALDYKFLYHNLIHIISTDLSIKISLLCSRLIE